MRFIALADLQIHNYRKFNDENNSRLRNCLLVIAKVFQFAAKNDVKVIMFAGDLFDTKDKLDTIVVNGAMEIFKLMETKYPDINFYAISGNHDQVSKQLIDEDAETSLKFLDLSVSNFHLADNGVVLNGGFMEEQIEFHCIPCYEYPEHFYQRLQEVVDGMDKKKRNFLMCHVTAVPKGANFAGNIDPEHELFKHFEFVIAGDVHAQHWHTDSFLMLGAPIQRHAGDLGVDMGFWIFDTEDPTEHHKFISLNSQFPVYRKVKEGEEVPEKYEKDFVIIEPNISEEDLDNVDQKDFANTESHASLVENYFNQVDGGDNEKLNVGLSLLKS